MSASFGGSAEIPRVRDRAESRTTTKLAVPTFLQHFLDLGEADLRTLAADITENGQREAIVLFEGKVLDGWNRTKACAIAGEEPVLMDFPEDADPVAYVLSRNLHRRHLTDSQRALAIVQCRAWASPADNQHRAYAPGAQAPATAGEMAKEADVSRRTIVDAKAAMPCHAWAPVGANQHGGPEPGSAPHSTSAQIAKEADVTDRLSAHAGACAVSRVGDCWRESSWRVRTECAPSFNSL